MFKKYFDRQPIDYFSKRHSITNIGFSHPKTHYFVNTWKIKSLTKQPKFRLFYLHATGNDALFPQISLFEKLIQRGGEIITFDLDGHGSNSKSVFCPHTITQNTVATLKHLSTSNSTALPIYLAGQSLGACLIVNCLNFDLDVANQVSNAFLISMPTDIQLDQINPIYELSGFFAPVFLKQFQYYGIYGAFPSVNQFKRQRFPIRLDNQLKNDYKIEISTFINHTFKTINKFEFDTPCHLIYGTRDTLSSPKQGKDILSKIKNANLIEIPLGTHFSTLFTSQCEDYISKEIQDSIVN